MPKATAHEQRDSSAQGRFNGRGDQGPRRGTFRHNHQRSCIMKELRYNWRQFAGTNRRKAAVFAMSSHALCRHLSRSAHFRSSLRLSVLPPVHLVRLSCPSVCPVAADLGTSDICRRQVQVLIKRSELSSSRSYCRLHLNGGLHACPLIWAHGWMDRWMDGWTDGRVEEQKDWFLHSAQHSNETCMQIHVCICMHTDQNGMCTQYVCNSPTYIHTGLGLEIKSRGLVLPALMRSALLSTSMHALLLGCGSASQRKVGSQVPA